MDDDDIKAPRQMLIWPWLKISMLESRPMMDRRKLLKWRLLYCQPWSCWGRDD